MPTTISAAQPAGVPGVNVQVGTTRAEPAQAGAAVTKIIVAVHGIGDQYSFATIQAVVNQFCTFYDQPAGVPLGNFHTGHPVYSLPVPYPREPFARLAFAEVYWAKIPREVASERHTLEESKKWAHTIVERLRLRWRGKGKQGGCADGDFRLLQQILSEMIQAIAVLDRICSLAERAGIFRFELRKLLDDYLGDVQIVTEFESNRVAILEAFAKVMRDAHQAFPQAAIYVVAHSEGTVVSLLGFLRAFRDETRPAWAHSVKGFMTLGSPIDKHLVLWPELFGDSAPSHVPARPIQWRNYYDRGDPVGFDLDDARAWLKMHKWDGVFDFPATNDHGFTRYPFPGKAHTDYWNDNAVFGHFIGAVIGERREPPASAASPPDPPPGDREINKWLSYVVPYVGIAALLFVGVYILFKAVVDATVPHDAAQSTGQIFAAVARNTLVLFGVTVAARVPRLTRNIRLRVGSLAFAALMCAIYYLTAPPGTGQGIAAGVPTAVLAGIIIVVASTLGVLLPHWGVVPLLVSGALVVIGKVSWHVLEARAANDIGPLWPVFIATAAFLYLWWLAALLFDLVAIWHWYIRQGKILVRMDEIMGGRRGPGPTATGQPPAIEYAPQVN